LKSELFGPSRTAYRRGEAPHWQVIEYATKARCFSTSWKAMPLARAQVNCCAVLEEAQVEGSAAISDMPVVSADYCRDKSDLKRSVLGTFARICFYGECGASSTSPPRQ